MGTSRVKKETARSSPRLIEHLLPPVRLRHAMDRRARAAPEQEAFLAEAPPLRDRLDVAQLEVLRPYDRLVILGIYWGNLSGRAVARATRSSQTLVRERLRRSLLVLRTQYPSRSAAGGAAYVEDT